MSQVSPEMAENPNSELALRDAAAGEMSLYEPWLSKLGNSKRGIGQ